MAEQSLAELIGVKAGDATTKAETPKKRKPIKAGSAEAKLLALLKRAGGQYPYAEIAPLVEKSRGGGGRGVDVDTLKSQVSKLRNTLIAPKDEGGYGFEEEKVNAIMPSDFNVGGRGRRAMADADVDDIAAFLESGDEGAMAKLLTPVAKPKGAEDEDEEVEL